MARQAARKKAKKSLRCQLCSTPLVSTGTRGPLPRKCNGCYKKHLKLK